jgi:hydrogenase maturation protease
MRRSEGAQSPFPGRTIVLCLGNKYLGDDGVGIRVAEDLASRDLGDAVVVDSCQTADLSLLASYEGAKKVVVVDALKSGAPPGAVSKYAMTPRKDPFSTLPESHSIALHDMFDVATQTGLLSCPVVILGIEPEDCGPGEGLSAEVERAIPQVISELVRELR